MVTGSGGAWGERSRGTQKRARGLESLQPFRHRSFALLWTAGLVSYVGSWMQTVAVGALVISQTGQGDLGGPGRRRGVPAHRPAVAGGRRAGRPAAAPTRARRSATCAAAASRRAARRSRRPRSRRARPRSWRWSRVQGSASALIGPFQQAILPDLVPKSGVPRRHLAEFGPVQPGPHRGARAGRADRGRVRLPGGVRGERGVVPGRRRRPGVRAASRRLAAVTAGLLASLRSGFGAARREPSCRAAIATIAVVAFLASPFIALVPVMAHHLTHGGARAVAQTTAVLTTAQGVGAVAGALPSRRWPSWLGRGRVLAWSLALLPATLVAYSTVAGALVGRGHAVRRRAGVHRGAVRAVDRGPAPGPGGLPGPGTQLLPGGSRRRLSGRLAGPGTGDRHRPGWAATIAGTAGAAVADHGGDRAGPAAVRPGDRHGHGPRPGCARPARRCRGAAPRRHTR